MKAIFVFILLVILLGAIAYAKNDTDDKITTKPTLTSTTPISNVEPTQPSENHGKAATKNEAVTKDEAAKENGNECPITARLYDIALATRGNGKKKNCTEPGEKFSFKLKSNLFSCVTGCFFVFEQLGWDFPAFLIENKKRGRLLYLTGCRYDIPFLLERTIGVERIHRAMRALRACYIGERVEAEKAYFCQPEYKENGTNFALNQGMDHSIREDGERDTWGGRFLPSTQNRCFNSFIGGIFFVNDNGKSLVVCCNNGGEYKKFRQDCKDVTTLVIDELEGRNQKNG
uniref:Uncharacterized protein n=1 Tax=Meloidogyne hapla TaxID=6305 RepID=A0A1I8B9M8_MELHA